MACTPIDVEFEIIQNGQLLLVRLGLTRFCLPDDTSEWTIKFEVSNRPDTSRAFDLVSKTVLPVPPEDHAGAEVIAHDGLCVEQKAQAWAAASVAMEVSSGNAAAADLNEQVLRILRVG